MTFMEKVGLVWSLFGIMMLTARRDACTSRGRLTVAGWMALGLFAVGFTLFMMGPC